MRTVRFLAVILLLCTAVALAKRPKTVDEAVQVLKTKWLKPKDLDWILRNPKDHVVGILYLPFGTGVRNEFGLWGNNQALRDSCGSNDPEGCSLVIFERLWESVRADADSSLVRKLDCQFQLSQSIHINEKDFYKLTTGQLLKAMQSQINDQLVKLAATSTSPCQTSLVLDVAGDPDLHCFVAIPHDKHAVDEVTNVPLDRALIGLGLNNLFTTVHNPPAITLEFARKCQFPKAPL